jgi:hypothetical protein
MLAFPTWGTWSVYCTGCHVVSTSIVAPACEILFLKNVVFWDVTPCGSFNYRRFRGS